MTDKNDGGPAFPHGIEDGTQTGAMLTGYQDGISLRDWLAGQALAGLCAFSGSYGLGNGPVDLAIRAREIADAMLRVRER